MSPLLLPFVLILYALKGKCPSTRLTSNILFYGYTLSVLVYTYFPETSQAVVLSWLSLLTSYLTIFLKVTVWRVKSLLVILTGLVTLNSFSVLFNSFDLLLLSTFYVNYSNIILRELTVLCVALCNIDKGVDRQIQITVFIAYLVEYAYITGL